SSRLRASTATGTYPLSLHDALPIYVADHGLLVSVAADRGVHGLGGPVGGAERRQREQLDRDAGRGQLVAREQRGGAELGDVGQRSEEHTSELQSRENLVCRLLLEKK